MSSQPSNSRTTKTKRGEPDGFFTCNLTWQSNSLPNLELSNETMQTCWQLTEFVTLILIGTVNNDAGHDNEAHAPGNEFECSSLFRVIASADISLDVQLFTGTAPYPEMETIANDDLCLMLSTSAGAECKRV